MKRSSKSSWSPAAIFERVLAKIKTININFDFRFWRTKIDATTTTVPGPIDTTAKKPWSQNRIAIGLKTYWLPILIVLALMCGTYKVTRFACEVSTISNQTISPVATEKELPIYLAEDSANMDASTIRPNGFVLDAGEAAVIKFDSGYKFGYRIGDVIGQYFNPREIVEVEGGGMRQGLFQSNIIKNTSGKEVQYMFRLKRPPMPNRFARFQSLRKESDTQYMPWGIQGHIKIMTIEELPAIKTEPTQGAVEKAVSDIGDYFKPYFREGVLP